MDSTESVLGSDAVKLFVERAADVRDRFEPGPDDLAILAQICRRLDGIPLAIELAAARVRSIALPDILGHLDDRFHLLAGGRRTAPTRQHTLRSAIDWSHDLLDDRERVVLRRLSVFSGGFDLAAVQAVAAGDGIDDFEIVDVLDQLVNKLLVSVDTNDVTSRYRFSSRSPTTAGSDSGRPRRPARLRPVMPPISPRSPHRPARGCAGPKKPIGVTESTSRSRTCGEPCSGRSVPDSPIPPCASSVVSP